MTQGSHSKARTLGQPEGGLTSNTVLSFLPRKKGMPAVCALQWHQLMNLSPLPDYY